MKASAVLNDKDVWAMRRAISNTNQIQSSLPNGKIDFDLICCGLAAPKEMYWMESNWLKRNLMEWKHFRGERAAPMKSSTIINHQFNQIKIILICLIDLIDWLIDLISFGEWGSSSATNNNSTSLLNQFQSISSIIDELMDWWRELIVVLLLLRGWLASFHQSTSTTPINCWPQSMPQLMELLN